MPKRIIGLLLLCLAPACCAAERPSEFILSYWCGPLPSETNEARYKEVANAGFNIAMPPCAAADVELNRKILDLCKRTGMRAIIADRRLLAKQPNDDDFTKNLDAVIADYASHPALFGYFLTDEPNASAFPLLGAVTQYLLKKDPKHVPYVNLFPNYASEQQLGTTTYEEHVKQFIEVVKPPLVSYDHYALVGDTERDVWWDNLEVVRRQCLAHDVPFVVIILSLPHGPYRDPTEGDLRWQAYSSLAYGAKGILYFTYWTPSPGDPLGYHGGIISYDGKRLGKYDMVKRVNAELAKLGGVLTGLKSTAVYRSNDARPNALIKTKGEDLVIGEFADAAKRKYVMIVNRSPRKSSDALFTVPRALEVVEVLQAGREETVVDSEFPLDLPVRTRLAAGGGKLYRIVE